MQISQLTQSGRIYLEQIQNQIQKSQGYKQIRTRLLNQLNQIHPDNPNSDDTLIPAIVSRLRREIVSENNQHVSRAIDIIEDLLKYANQVIEPYFCTEQICMTLSIAINYKKLFTMNKALFEQNKLRLGSIVMYYYQKFQNEPQRYVHMLKIYKQLKEKNCEFPLQSFIIVPKDNQFKKSVKKGEEKMQKDNRMIVDFQGIKQSVGEMEEQFYVNKKSCVNTQFVRVLKIKAKMLYDMSQNQDKSVTLNNQQKQQAKVLYKTIRTMLKEIQKISEQKIQEEKIKSQKQFAQVKIEQITPKKKDSSISSPSTESIKKKPKGQTNLLEKEEVIKIQINLKKTSSLLDDDEQSGSGYVDSGLLDISEKIIDKVSTPIKPIKKPNSVKYEDLLGETTTQNDLISGINVVSPQKPEQTLDFSRKSIDSVHSYSRNSGVSEQSCNVIKNPPSSNIRSPKQLSENKAQNNNNDELVFNNEQLFSRFEIVNRFKDTNNYNELLNDVDFSDKSSQSYRQGQRVTFQVNQDDNDIFGGQNERKQYDNSTFTPKKQSSFVQRSYNEQQHNKNKNKDNLSSSAQYNKNEEKITSPIVINHDFGVLADTREVKAYDYSIFNNKKANNNNNNNNIPAGRSSICTEQQDEQRNIRLTPSSAKHSTIRSHKSTQQLSPDMMNFNISGLKQNKQKLLQDRDEDEDEFEDYQRAESLIEEQSSERYQNSENMRVVSPEKKRQPDDHNSGQKMGMDELIL